MELNAIIVLGVVLFILLAIGGGIGYWVFLATRTKKMTWKALVYQVGDGEIKFEDSYVLSELVPYTEDIIEKIDKKNGATHYWLQKMRKATPVVTADCVEVWSQNNKVVRVLLQGDTCTLLKMGYDKQIGSQIFKPMPHDRINMQRTELAERKDRIQDKKDILAALAPFITASIWVVGMVIITYLIIQGAIESSKNNQIAADTVGASVNNLGNAMLKIYGYDPQSLNTSDTREIIKEPLPP